MVRGKPHSAQTPALRPLTRVRGQISVIGSGVCTLYSGGGGGGGDGGGGRGGDGGGVLHWHHELRDPGMKETHGLTRYDPRAATAAQDPVIAHMHCARRAVHKVRAAPRTHGIRHQLGQQAMCAHQHYTRAEYTGLGMVAPVHIERSNIGALTSK